jgi:hypothetical protein
MKSAADGEGGTSPPRKNARTTRHKTFPLSGESGLDILRMHPAPLEPVVHQLLRFDPRSDRRAGEFGRQRGSRADLHFASDRGDIVLKNLAIGSQTGMFASVAL